jgi:hypothetical protein
VDASIDVRRDVGPIDQARTDTSVVPLINPDTAIDSGPVLIDTCRIDTPLDGAGLDGTVTIDVAIDESVVDVGAVDAEIDTSAID